MAEAVVRLPQLVILVSASAALALALPGVMDVIRGESVQFVWEQQQSSSDISSDLVVRQAWLRGPVYDSVQLAWSIVSNVSANMAVDNNSPSSSILSPLSVWPSRDAFLADAHPLDTLSRAPSAVVAKDALVLSLISSSEEAGAAWSSALGAVQHAGLKTEFSAHSAIEILHRLPPFSFSAGLLLFCAYLAGLLYLVISLKRTPALRSRCGLFVAFSVEVLYDYACILSIYVY